MKAIGLMSGTSLDGLDIAYVDIHGHSENTKINLLQFATIPYAPGLKEKIILALDEEKSNNKLLCQLNIDLGLYYVDALKQFFDTYHIDYQDIAFIASHGQTIYHQVQQKPYSTLQLGDPSAIAYTFNIDVIFNFRVMDMIAGGQGAPLIPYSDYILYRKPDQNIALQNIGGIGNVTYIPKQATLDDIVAFDTGPGNMMIDEAMQVLYHLPYDDHGQIALQGQLHSNLFNELMDDDYFHITPPKSTGREHFGKQYVHYLLQKYDIPKQDMIHTLTKFTAQSIIESYQNYLGKVDEIILTGGGSHNLAIQQFLKEYGSIIRVDSYVDSKEAIGFAILGNQTLHQKPSNCIKATGAKHPVILGQIIQQPRRFLYDNVEK